jgi:hypothetical protein
MEYTNTVRVSESILVSISSSGHFVANLSGKSISPQINKTSSGQATLNLTSHGSKLAYIIKAHGLDQVKSAALKYILNDQAIISISCVYSLAVRWSARSDWREADSGYKLSDAKIAFKTFFSYI